MKYAYERQSIVGSSEKLEEGGERWALSACVRVPLS